MFVQSHVKIWLCKFICMYISYRKFFVVPWLRGELHKELWIFHAVMVAAAVLKTSPSETGCGQDTYYDFVEPGTHLPRQACSCLLVWALQVRSKLNDSYKMGHRYL